MKIRKKLNEKLRGKSVNDRIQICINCGSIRIARDKTKLKCKDCNTNVRIKNEKIKSKFKIGDSVKIINSENSDLTYTIKKIKKSYDGLEYLLKSDSDSISLLFQENEDSYLKKNLIK